MTQENFIYKKNEVVFPEDNWLVIEKILKKYNLADLQITGFEKITNSSDANEVMKIMENLPGAKIARLA